MSDQGLKYQTGSWSLDPLAPQVLAPDLVQMFHDGQGKKWRRCGYRWSVPTTAMFRSRHGNIHATLRVVGESAHPTVATIRSRTRGPGGTTFLDVVSLHRFSFHHMLIWLTLSQVSIAPMRRVHIDAYSRRSALVLYSLMLYEMTLRLTVQCGRWCHCTHSTEFQWPC